MDRTNTFTANNHIIYNKVQHLLLLWLMIRQCSDPFHWKEKLLNTFVKLQYLLAKLTFHFIALAAICECTCLLIKFGFL